MLWNFQNKSNFIFFFSDCSWPYSNSGGCTSHITSLSSSVIDVSCFLLEQQSWQKPRGAGVELCLLFRDAGISHQKRKIWLVCVIIYSSGLKASVCVCLYVWGWCPSCHWQNHLYLIQWRIILYKQNDMLHCGSPWATLTEDWITDGQTEKRDGTLDAVVTFSCTLHCLTHEVFCLNVFMLNKSNI